MGLIIKVNRCKGCGICVEFCPKQVLLLNEIGKITVIDQALCSECKQCEMHCPDYAIFVEK